MPVIHVVFYLLVPAVAMCLAWGIRGQTGHEWGAALCGATLGLALAMVSRDRAKVGKAFSLAAWGGFGYAFGGMMSYGNITGTATNSAASNGLIALCLAQGLLVGAIWGGLGGAVLGIACSPRNYGLARPLMLLAACYLGGWAANEVLINVMHCDVGHRHQTWAFMLGAWLVLLVVCARDRAVLAMSVLGALGIGLGFVVGPLLTRACAYPLIAGLHGRWNWWNLDSWKVAEHTIGFCGGLGVGLALMLLERRGQSAYLPEKMHPLRSFCAQAVALWFIPGWNLNNVAVYWAFEKNVISAEGYGFILFAWLAALVAAAGVSLARLYGRASCCRLGADGAAALGLLWLVWAGTFVAGLKMLWPYQGPGFVFTQAGFAAMAVVVTCYLFLRAPAEGA